MMTHGKHRFNNALEVSLQTSLVDLQLINGAVGFHHGSSQKWKFVLPSKLEIVQQAFIWDPLKSISCFLYDTVSADK